VRKYLHAFKTCKLLKALINQHASSIFSALNAYPFAFTIKSRTCTSQSKAFNRESKPPHTTLQVLLSANSSLFRPDVTFGHAYNKQLPANF